jgi:L-rhamnonate dehydratase
MSRSFPLVKSVKAFVLKSGSGQGQSQGADCHDVEDKHWINGYPTPIANPMSIYRQYAPSRKSWGINALGTMVVCVEADDGNIGVGVSIGGEPGKRFVLQRVGVNQLTTGHEL